MWWSCWCLSLSICKSKEGISGNLLSDILNMYKSCDIFILMNVSCSLFFLPNKTVSYRNNKFNGVKKSRERLVILLAVNIGSSEKLTPLVMDTFLKPRSLKTANIPMYFTMQSKHVDGNKHLGIRNWTELDRNWLEKVIIIASILTAHSIISNLCLTKFVFLLPNSTCTAHFLGR